LSSDPRSSGRNPFPRPARTHSLPSIIVGNDSAVSLVKDQPPSRSAWMVQTWLLRQINLKKGGLADSPQNKQRSLRSLEWLNVFLADVQTGLGPFLAAYLASSGWNPSRVGYALTFGGLVTVTVQTPAGAVVDAVRRKRLLIAVNLGLLVCGAFLLIGHLSAISVYAAQFLIGTAGPFLGPTVAAITLGLVGAKAFDKQFGKNQAFNSAGNVFTALLIAYVSYKFGYRAIFAVAIVMAIPAVLSVFKIDGKQIDYAQARGATDDEAEVKTEGLSALAKDHVLLYFLATAFLFHLANAAMLPQLGEMLAKDDLKKAAPIHVCLRYRYAVCDCRLRRMGR
jgi:MFS family permease